MSISACPRSSTARVAACERMGEAPVDDAVAAQSGSSAVVDGTVAAPSTGQSSPPRRAAAAAFRQAGESGRPVAASRRPVTAPAAGRRRSPALRPSRAASSIARSSRPSAASAGGTTIRRSRLASSGSKASGRAPATVKTSGMSPAAASGARPLREPRCRRPEAPRSRPGRIRRRQGCARQAAGRACAQRQSPGRRPRRFGSLGARPPTDHGTRCTMHSRHRQAQGRASRRRIAGRDENAERRRRGALGDPARGPRSGCRVVGQEEIAQTLQHDRAHAACPARADGCAKPATPLDVQRPASGVLASAQARRPPPPSSTGAPTGPAPSSAASDGRARGGPTQDSDARVRPARVPPRGLPRIVTALKQRHRRRIRGRRGRDARGAGGEQLSSSKDDDEQQRDRAEHLDRRLAITTAQEWTRPPCSRGAAARQTVDPPPHRAPTSSLLTTAAPSARAR